MTNYFLQRTLKNGTYIRQGITSPPSPSEGSSRYHTITITWSQLFKSSNLVIFKTMVESSLSFFSPCSVHFYIFFFLTVHSEMKLYLNEYLHNCMKYENNMRYFLNKSVLWIDSVFIDCDVLNNVHLDTVNTCGFYHLTWIYRPWTYSTVRSFLARFFRELRGLF